MTLPSGIKVLIHFTRTTEQRRRPVRGKLTPALVPVTECTVIQGEQELSRAKVALFYKDTPSRKKAHAAALKAACQGLDRALRGEILSTYFARAKRQA